MGILFCECCNLDGGKCVYISVRNKPHNSMNIYQRLIENNIPLFWCDPEPIEGNDYRIKTVEHSDGDEMAVISYGVGSEAEVFIEEIIIHPEVNNYLNIGIENFVCRDKVEVIRDGFKYTLEKRLPLEGEDYLINDITRWNKANGEIGEQYYFTCSIPLMSLYPPVVKCYGQADFHGLTYNHCDVTPKGFYPHDYLRVLGVVVNIEEI